MKKTLFTLSFICTMAAASMAQWSIDKGHTKFAFIAEHHGLSEVDGYFKKFDGKITAAKDDLSDAVFEITIESASLNTDLEMRDKHLKSEDMFDVEKFPAITFKSTSFKKKKVKGKNNQYTMVGDLTIKGVTKPVTMEVTMNGPMAHPNPENKIPQLGIKALTTIKRSDFGNGGKLATIMVGDEISIRATGEFQKK